MIKWHLSDAAELIKSFTSICLINILGFGVHPLNAPNPTARAQQMRCESDPGSSIVAAKYANHLPQSAMFPRISFLKFLIRC